MTELDELFDAIEDVGFFQYVFIMLQNSSVVDFVSY